MTKQKKSMEKKREEKKTYFEFKTLFKHNNLVEYVITTFTSAHTGECKF